MRKYLKEAPESVVPSDYTNTDFKPFVVGNSNPLADKINPALLKDVDLARVTPCVEFLYPSWEVLFYGNLSARKGVIEFFRDCLAGVARF